MLVWIAPLQQEQNHRERARLQGLAALGGHGATRAGRMSQLPRAAGGKARLQGHGKELGASEDSGQESATKLTASRIEARGSVSIKHSHSNLK